MRRKAASFREWLEYRSRPESTGPEAAQVVKALETCDGEGSAPSWSDVLDRFVEYSREVNGVCTSDPNMTEHTFEEGRTKTNIRVEGRARTLYLGGKKPAQDSGTHLGSREDGDNRVKKMEGTPGLDTNATWEEEIPEQNKITADAVERMMERQDRERREGRLGADETLFPEGAPQRHINWQDEGYELFVGYGHGASAIRVGELQEDPLTRFLLRYDEFETGGELRDGKGAQIKMGKDSEPLQSGKGRALNVKVAQTCLALHVSHQFTHFAATDGGKDHEDKLEEDGKYVPNPRVAYGVFEGPTRFGRRVPGDAQVKEPNGIGPCGEEEIRTAFGAGMWGGKLPSTWEPIDAEMYAILAYLRKMASASDAQSRRCLVLCDCKPALQQIESAYRKGMPEGLRDWGRGGLLEAIAHYRSKLEAVVFMWVPAHVGIACNAYADAVATAYLGNNDTEDASKVVREAVRTRPCMYTARRKATEDTETREIADRRTYGHMRQGAHEWV